MYLSPGPSIARLSGGAGAPAHHPLVGFSRLSTLFLFPMMLLAWAGVVGFEVTVETLHSLCLREGKAGVCGLSLGSS